MEGCAYVGTSGWSYKAWAETFYPAGTGPKLQLPYYAQRFPTVEINASFYRLPTQQALESWKEQAPDGFQYAIKGSRSVTHYKKLDPAAKSFDLLMEWIGVLQPHLGPVLWQLPPNLSLDLERLDRFLTALPSNRRHAMEFRHPSWWQPEVLERLRRHRVALVSVSSQRMPPYLELTTDFTYVRFHGLEGGAAHDYTERELQPWAEHLRNCARNGVTAYAYFNNDVNTCAPFNALALMDMLGDAAVRPKASQPQTRPHQARTPPPRPRQGLV